MKKRNKTIVAIEDLLLGTLPARLLPKPTPGAFGFLVHSRDHRDLYRQYPFARLLPERAVLFLMRRLWPITLSEVTGVKDVETGEPVRGYVFGIPMTARQLVENRTAALRKIRQAVRLAERRGASIVGLGGLTSSLSKGGLDVVGHTSLAVTTGHAYTAFNVTQNLWKVIDIFGLDRAKVRLAIVGAAGSVGSSAALLAARGGINDIMLVDLERKAGAFAELKAQMEALGPGVSVSMTHRIGDITGADFVIAATNAPEALITNDVLKRGAVVIDDAQPSDVAPDVLTRDDVLVIEAGVVHTPDIFSHFNFGLKHKTDNFCCMAELLILAAHRHDSHFVINRTTLEQVDQIAAMGARMGFEVGAFQNFLEKLSHDKIARIREIARTTHGIHA